MKIPPHDLIITDPCQHDVYNGIIVMSENQTPFRSLKECTRHPHQQNNIEKTPTTSISSRIRDKDTPTSFSISPKSAFRGKKYLIITLLSKNTNPYGAMQMPSRTV